MKSFMAAFLVWIFVTYTDALKCVSCQNFVNKVNGEIMAPSEGQVNNADCKSDPDEYMVSASCPAESGVTARCVFADVTVTGKIEGTDIENTMVYRGCANDPEVTNGCETDGDLTKLMGDVTAGITDAKIKGKGCICNDKDYCNSAIGVHSVRLFAIALIALVALFV